MNDTAHMNLTKIVTEFRENQLLVSLWSKLSLIFKEFFYAAAAIDDEFAKLLTQNLVISEKDLEFIKNSKLFPSPVGLWFSFA